MVKSHSIIPAKADLVLIFDEINGKANVSKEREKAAMKLVIFSWGVGMLRWQIFFPQKAVAAGEIFSLGVQMSKSWAWL